MRTFIAIDLSDEFKTKLIDYQPEFDKLNSKAKWVSAENMHLTLLFLGDISDQEIDQVKTVLDKIDIGGFELKFDNLGRFMQKKGRAVLWAGLKAPDALYEIVEFISKNLQNIPSVVSAKPFVPHITIARFKNLNNKKEFKEKVMSLTAEPITCNIDKIILYSSELTPVGPIYAKIHEKLFKSEVS